MLTSETSFDAWSKSAEELKDVESLTSYVQVQPSS